MATLSFEERYKNLNKAQREAVDTIDGPVLVIAGPGSGKTEILSLRVANILLKTDTPASSILCLTFTESAALNMRSRLSSIISRDAYRVGIHTFHGFCTDVISRYPEYFFGHADFHPADDVTRLEILSTLFRLMAYDNPLRSEHPDQGFVFLRPALGSISDLKRAGIAPDEFKKVLNRNEIILKQLNALAAEYIPERISKKDIGVFRDLYEAMKKLTCPPLPLPHIRCLRDVLAESLLVALTAAQDEGKTTVLSDWKKNAIAKVEDVGADGNANDRGDTATRFVFKETERLPKMRSLADLYADFQKQMYDEGYFDFDDMILEVVEAIEKNPNLALSLQESYQYILVDEFQDTNDAQMRLLLAITSAAVHESRPNIMAVGDDDQAIYKFQGAEVANILSFRNHFKNPAIITLNTNYRSTPEILTVSEEVISQSTQSLRALMPEIEKKIVSARSVGGAVDAVAHPPVHFLSFDTTLEEYNFVAHEIRRLLDAGAEPDSIAVIGRTHSSLKALIPYVSGKVPVRYEKQRDVLADVLVRELLTLVRFINTLNSYSETEADEYLPEILAFPFWKLSRETIWRVSTEAQQYARKVGESVNGVWLETMRNFADTSVRNIAEFLLHAALEAKTLPLERVLDLLIGSAILSVPETTDENGAYDSTEDPFENESAKNSSTQPSVMISPFRDYYFNTARFATEKSEYVSFLSSLRVFIGALREYRQGKVLTVADCVAFIGVYEKNNMQLLDESPYISAEKAVHFLTAHKAKGLEYDTVFVLSATDEIWSSRGIADKLPFPRNIIARPSADSVDDKMRLLYVALTRARTNLYVSHYETSENGKQSLLVEFLSPLRELFVKGVQLSNTVDDSTQSNQSLQSLRSLETHVFSLVAAPYSSNERAVLSELVKNYAMPVTHLNNFLDVVRGGPSVFLEQNLLRFPQAKTVSSVYGTAIHGAVEYIYTHLKRETILPPAGQVKKHFEKLIRVGKLHPSDEKTVIVRGHKVIELMLAQKKDDFIITDKIEVDFKNQGVCVSEDGVTTQITGKIDRMRIKGSEVFVTDWKTGKAKLSWDGKDAVEKVQLHNYKRQILFYKLLVEGSKTYGEYRVEQGCLSFLEPVGGKLGGKSEAKFVELPLVIEQADVDRLKKLIEAVHLKICNLDFPDVSKYSHDLNGVIAFEDDLLEGRV